MQRVVSINLNGNAYQLEERGYNALFAYLDAREAEMKDDPDRAEKMADIERQVAEKCQVLLTPTKTVITSAEIDRLIREIGPAPAADADSTSRSSWQSAPSGPSGANARSSTTTAGAAYTHRRLYQIREGAMISGVCVGLSEYLHLDVTLLRILFVIFALVSSGWGVLVYGALMFILPHVNTRAEAAEGAQTGTHHWPWDSGWPWDRNGWAWDRSGWPWDGPATPPRSATPSSAAPPASTSSSASNDSTAGTTAPPPTQAPTPADEWRNARQSWRDERREWRAQRRAARLAYHPWSMWGTLGMVIGLMFAFFWLSFWTRGHFFFGWPFFWGFPHWIGIVFFFLLLRLVFMPFGMARWYGYGYGPYPPHPQHAWVAMWNGLAFFLAIIFCVWFAYHYIPEVHDMIRGFQSSWTDGSFHV